MSPFEFSLKVDLTYDEIHTLYKVLLLQYDAIIREHGHLGSTVLPEISLQDAVRCNRMIRRLDCLARDICRKLS